MLAPWPETANLKFAPTAVWNNWHKTVSQPIPRFGAADTVRRSASTPARWPSGRGRPRCFAQRPFPSMTTATCNGRPSEGAANGGFSAAAMRVNAILRSVRPKPA